MCVNRVTYCVDVCVMFHLHHAYMIFNTDVWYAVRNIHHVIATK